MSSVEAVTEAATAWKLRLLTADVIASETSEKSM